MKYKKLAIENAAGLRFGFAPHPVTTSKGLVIGSGAVYPELKFTLPPITINAASMHEIEEHYVSIAQGALERAVQLGQKGLVLEFETLLEMTMQPEIGLRIVEILNGICEDFRAKEGIVAEVRLTPNDARDFERPPRQRSSRYLEPMFELFDKGARAGGEMLSIESTGGKEIHDDAIMFCDVQSAAFALTVLGVRDMHFLWEHIVRIAKGAGRLAGGDTACGFANTAMMLAEKHFIPRVFAAVDRAISVVRTLPAYEEGAVGPDKDCGYEGPFMKAIAGIPISMEGKTAACAHMSPVGNIAAACADLWSNESVQNIKLLSGMAPTVYFEQLTYDTRLMNAAIKNGSAAMLQRLFVESDAYTDPQALVLAPESVIAISKAIVESKDYVDAGRNAGLTALKIIGDAHKSGQLVLDEREVDYASRIADDLAAIPDNESAFIEMMLPRIDREKCLLNEYGIEV